MPSLSVVIPTYNRRERLALVLSALGAQSVLDFEVVVIDDGSSDGTSEWLAQQAPKFTLRSIRLANGGPARARNAGVEAARGEIILFIDDDVVPTPELVAEHLRSQAEPNVVVIGPLASLPSYAQPWVAWEQAKIEAQYVAMERGDWAPSFRQFWTGNASVGRAHLLAAGLFDPSFLRAEDVELGLRLEKCGLAFRFNPRARGIHHAERSLRSWEGVLSSYGRHDVAILGKLGERQLLELLGGNWHRLSPALRWLVSGCIDKPRRHAAVCHVLRKHLELAEKLSVPILSRQACSALASLLYWQASSETLGRDRAAVVFGK